MRHATSQEKTEAVAAHSLLPPVAGWGAVGLSNLQSRTGLKHGRYPPSPCRKPTAECPGCSSRGACRHRTDREGDYTADPASSWVVEDQRIPRPVVVLRRVGMQRRVQPAETGARAGSRPPQVLPSLFQGGRLSSRPLDTWRPSRWGKMGRTFLWADGPESVVPVQLWEKTV